MSRRTMTTIPFWSVPVQIWYNNEAGDDDESVLFCAGKNNEADDDDDEYESVLVKVMKYWAVLVWYVLVCVAEFSVTRTQTRKRGIQRSTCM